MRLTDSVEIQSSNTGKNHVLLPDDPQIRQRLSQACLNEKSISFTDGGKESVIDFVNPSAKETPAQRT